MVMTTIVVPLDGSAFAERAVRPAVSFAARLARGRVLLVTCDPDDIDAAQHQLDDRAALFSDVVEVDTRIIRDGDPADTILATVAAESDALLCMATHGRGGLRATVLGSVANRVVCRSAQPIILVGPRWRTTLLPAERGRMLVCSDGSLSSASILPVAATWCDRLQLTAWLTEVVGPDEDPEPAHRPHPNREVEAANSRLEELAARLSTTTPASTKVLHGSPGSSIAWFAEQLPAALIAMAAHGRSGLTRITMGSVANEVIRHASCPILITRPSDAEACIDG
jgi:nucleotide-binding universal stress UspA family protein